MESTELRWSLYTYFIKYLQKLFWIYISCSLKSEVDQENLTYLPRKEK